MPLLVVPPTINKYYIVDLAPGRSLVEYLVASGQQVFVISWRNPDARHRDWGVDTYGAGDPGGAATPRRICRRGQSPPAGALLRRDPGRDGRWPTWPPPGTSERVAGFGLAVAVLDQARAGTAGALLDERDRRGGRRPRRQPKGYLDGRALAEVFAWLRPDDLIWSYWVNNYLQGRTPAPFDILYWNADTDQDDRGPAPRLPAARRRQRPHPARGGGHARHAGRPGQVDTDAYVVAGVADHICPWQSCYRSTQLLGGRTPLRAVHQRPHRRDGQPAGQPEGQLPDARPNPADPARLAGRGDHRAGSWWPDYSAGWRERGGGRRGRPRRPRRRRPAPMEPAPGTYVLGPVRRPAERTMRTVGRRRRSSCASAVRPGDGAPHPAGARQRHRGQPGAAATVRRRPRPRHRGGPLRRARRRRLARCRGSPYRLPRLARLVARLLDRLGLPAGGRAGDLLGRRPGPAVRPRTRASAAGAWCWSPPAPAR